MIIYCQSVSHCDVSSLTKERRIISITYLHSIISHSHSFVNEENAVSSRNLLGNGPQRICRAEGQCGNREDRLGQHDERPRWMAIFSIGQIYGAFQDSQSSPASDTTTTSIPQDAGPAKYLNTWPADDKTRFIEGMCGFLKSTCVPKKQPLWAGREHAP